MSDPAAKRFTQVSRRQPALDMPQSVSDQALAIGVILLVYGLFLSPIQFRYRVKRNWDRYPKIKKDFDIAVSEAGVDVMDDKGNPSHSGWDSFVRYGETKSLFLLFLSPLLPLCLPKRLVAEGDVGELRQLIASAVGRQDKGEQNADGNPH